MNTQHDCDGCRLVANAATEDDTCSNCGHDISNHGSHGCNGPANQSSASCRCGRMG